MNYSTRLADTIHLLAAIQIVRESAERTGRDLRHLLSSAGLADSMRANPAYLRKLMGIAARGGLLASEKGKANPRLTRSACEISLLDIYRAVEGKRPLLKLAPRANPPCDAGKAIQFAIDDAYDEVQRAAEAALSRRTLQDIISDYYARAGPDILPD